MTARMSGKAVFVAVSVMALAMTGCATGQSSKAATSAAYDSSAAVSGKLTIMGFGTGDDVATTRFDTAKAALPDVQVDLVKGQLDVQQFLSSVAANQAPDIIYGNRDQIDSFAARGAVLPLEECISGESISTGSPVIIS